MLANWITLSRFPILMTTVLALYLGSPTARLAGVRCCWADELHCSIP